MGSQGFDEHDTVRRSAGVLVGSLGDRVVACDVIIHEAHVVGGLLAWLVLLDEATPLSDLVADVVASTGSPEEEARVKLTEALQLGQTLHLLDRRPTGPGPARAQQERTVRLRAGAVRSPSGDIWLLPLGNDSGVTRLIGELVRAGCDDLGREVVTIHGGSIVVDRPTSPQGEHWPIARILACEFLPEHEASAVPLDPYRTVEELVGSALDLSSAGDPGLQMMCDLAAAAPGLRVQYHDAAALSGVLIAAEDWDALEGLDQRLRRHSRQHHGIEIGVVRYLSDLVVGPSAGFVFRNATIEGEEVTFVVDPSGCSSWALTGLHRRIWLAVTSDVPTSLSDLAREEADSIGGSDERSARLVARALISLMDQGLVNQTGGEVDPGTADLAGGGNPSEVVQGVRRYGLGSQVPPVSVAQPWLSLASCGYAIEWLGHRLVTDVDSVHRVLVGIQGAAPAAGRARLTQHSALVEIRSIPGRAGEMLIRLNGTRLRYVSEDDGLSVLGIILANLAADHDRFAQPLGEISMTTRYGRCVVTVGGASAPEPGHGDEGAARLHEHLFGVRVDDRRLLIPEPARAVYWLSEGASTNEVARVWIPCALAGVVAVGARDVLHGWLQTLTELAPDEGVSERYLAETAAHGDVRMSVVNDGETVSEAAERILSDTDDRGRIPEVKPAAAGAGRIVTEPSAAETELSSAAMQWATRLGRASWSAKSAKVTRGRLSIGRGLLKIRLTKEDYAYLGGPTSLAGDPIRGAIAELGLDVETSDEVARASVAAGNLHLGVEPAGSHIRRKLYVRGLPAPDWQQIASRWPRGLRHGDDIPYALAWKWIDDGSGGIEQGVYLARLGGAETIGQQVDPLIDVMQPEWADVVVHLLGVMGVGGQQVPDEGDLLTLEAGGRRSVDIARRSPVRGSYGFEAESRWLAHAAALSEADSRDLVDWSHGRCVSRLIFGIDGQGEPFVNLYVSQLTDR